jgi:hypothetical protein
MNYVFNSLTTYFLESWPELIWIIAAAGTASFLASRRSRSNWTKREFLGRLNVSLTSLHDGQLQVRTIFEMDTAAIMFNSEATKAIAAAAKQTNVDNPILPLPNDIHWDYLNPVLNELSSRFSNGYLKRDIGSKVQCKTYLIALTCECSAPTRTRKVRALITQKNLLLNLPEKEPTFEMENLKTRWKTLQQLAEQYKRSKNQFIEIEICV